MEKGIQSAKLKVRQLVITGMLSSIAIFLGLTGLGFVKIPPVQATIMHIPVIIGAIIEGPIVGAFIGLCFGLFSMYQAFTAPTPTSFIFWNPIVALLPRILIGVISYYSYTFMKKAVNKNAKVSGIAVIALFSLMIYLVSRIFLGTTPSAITGVISLLVLLGLFFRFNVSKKNQVLTIGTASILGTLANTIGVLGLVYLIYIDKFAKVIKISPDRAGKFIVGIGVTNGIPEALISAVITIPVVIAVLKIRK